MSKREEVLERARAVLAKKVEPPPPPEPATDEEVQAILDDIRKTSLRKIWPDNIA